MSGMNCCKECPGCGKQFRRNRSRKRHILGHTYNEGTEKKTIVACASIRDADREWIANEPWLKKMEAA